MQINFDLKKSIRGAFGEELAELGKTNPDIVALDADLSGSTQTSIFAKSFPDRFFDVGIAEQNLITTALGLSLEEKIPFAATFAVFATGRCYDQIRNSVCYQKANVKIIGAHGGITVGEDGASHQALEDVALMRCLPNMTVIVPGDAEQTKQAVRFAAEHKGPVYIRLSRTNVPVVFGENYKFDINKIKKLDYHNILIDLIANKTNNRKLEEVFTDMALLTVKILSNMNVYENNAESYYAYIFYTTILKVYLSYLGKEQLKVFSEKCKQYKIKDEKVKESLTRILSKPKEEQ